MDEQKQDDQQEPTYSSSVPIRDVVLNTCRKQWTIEKCGEKGSGISVLMAPHDYIYIYIHVCELSLLKKMFQKPDMFSGPKRHDH